MCVRGRRGVCIYIYIDRQTDIDIDNKHIQKNPHVLHQVYKLNADNVT